MPKKKRKLLERAGVSGASRHLFFCIGPDCCRPKKGDELWSYAKRRISELGLKVMRTKAACFRICSRGPWLVVYPDGTWYGKLTPERLERILQEHVIDGRPVTEWIEATNRLTGGDLSPEGEKPEAS